MLNSDKTKVILLGPEHLRYQLSGDVVSVDGIALASNTTVKNLSAIFDRDLSFNSHVFYGTSFTFSPGGRHSHLF